MRPSWAPPFDPVLQQQMAAHPAQKLPIIVAMDGSVAHVAGTNLQLAEQALGLLRLNGLARAALPLVSGAAGLADAAGIQALALLPGVAYVAEDAQVASHAALGSAYPVAVGADRVWAAGGTADMFASSVYSAIYGQPLRWKNGLLGGLLWGLSSWANLAWDNLAWDNLAWDNIAWATSPGRLAWTKWKPNDLMTTGTAPEAGSGRRCR